jgi:hypothetical protein
MKKKVPSIILAILLIGIAWHEKNACDRWTAEAEDCMVKISKLLPVYEAKKYGPDIPRKLARMSVELELESAESLLEESPIFSNTEKLKVAVRNGRDAIR